MIVIFFQAHALTARLNHQFEFPFLCLLISGGHSLLTLVKSISEFELLGEHLDDAPGEAMDKVARRLKIHNLPEFEKMSGGAAIEKAAKDVVVDRTYTFPLPLSGRRDCQFSFAGLKNSAQRAIKNDELELGEMPCQWDVRDIVIESVFLFIDLELPPNSVIPNYKQFCASFLRGVLKEWPV
jgi:N6-L-threonylcarbamoyladenine synthase